MGKLIDKIRSWFCKHEFEHVNSTSIKKVKAWNTDTHCIDIYICKKCGCIKKVTT